MQVVFDFILSRMPYRDLNLQFVFFSMLFANLFIAFILVEGREQAEGGSGAVGQFRRDCGPSAVPNLSGPCNAGLSENLAGQSQLLLFVSIYLFLPL